MYSELFDPRLIQMHNYEFDDWSKPWVRRHCTLLIPPLVLGRCPAPFCPIFAGRRGCWRPSDVCDWASHVLLGRAAVECVWWNNMAQG